MRAANFFNNRIKAEKVMTQRLSQASAPEITMESPKFRLARAISQVFKRPLNNSFTLLKSTVKRLIPGVPEKMIIFCNSGHLLGLASHCNKNYSS